MLPSAVGGRVGLGIAHTVAGHARGVARTILISLADPFMLLKAGTLVASPLSMGRMMAEQQLPDISDMPYGTRALQIDIEFVDHLLVLWRFCRPRMKQ